jgi:hypothetical protein
MGLLATAMPPVQAAALLIVPSLVTNVWQMIAGPALGPIVRRLWPVMAGVCLGTWAGIGLMSGASARTGTILLGVALALYALSGLWSLRASIARSREKILGPLTGAITGLVAAATGVFVIPAVPYLQAIGLEKDELVQALGLSFTVSTIALSVNVAAAGAVSLALAGPTVLALAVAGIGMALGQAVRARLAPPVFRRWFFVGLLALGIYLVGRAL